MVVAHESGGIIYLATEDAIEEAVAERDVMVAAGSGIAHEAASTSIIGTVDIDATAAGVEVLVA